MDLEATGLITAAIVKRLDVILISVCQLLALLVIAIGVCRALGIYLRGLVMKAPRLMLFCTAVWLWAMRFESGTESRTMVWQCPPCG